MKSDSQSNPKSTALDDIELQELLDRARLPDDSENSDIRSEAIRALHAIYLEQLAVAPRNEQHRRSTVDRRLKDLFDGLSIRIWASETPIGELESLFRSPARRGPKAKNEARDFQIALSIQKYLNRGETIEKAIAENAELEHLSESRIKKIWLMQREEETLLGLRAEAAFEKEITEIANVKSSNSRRIRGPDEVT